ncbi:MAG TPA: CocE/NonD family hydrolase [Solirubrobacteraceae bacterium]|nr:CocE/NonD family hydrolase [Solirubrobacteraceae bacterium]
MLASTARAAICALGALLLIAAPAPAAGFSKQTYRVAVTQPDEAGAPVAIDTDVYLPSTPPPPGGYPFVEVYHGGGSKKDNPFDAGYAQKFAENGYVSLLYSQRGHAGSDGQTAVAGPKEMRDLFDVTAWALGSWGIAPSHPDFHIDASRIGLSGFSQGGLHVNLGQAYQGDPALNPYAVHFVALEPSNTPDYVIDALMPNRVVKLSFVAGLIETYSPVNTIRPAPALPKILAALAADQPALLAGRKCDTTGHDTPTSSPLADLAARSVGCFADRITPPLLWAQSFDDGLFPAEMAIAMFHRLSNPDDRLYLNYGGHAAPSEDRALTDERLRVQLAFFDHVFTGATLTLPRVTYWTRDPSVVVPGDSNKYPRGAWFRQTSDDWPPADVRNAVYHLGADGRAVSGPATGGSLPLRPVSADLATDPVVASALSATPLGTSPAAPFTTPAASDVAASFTTPTFKVDHELSGAPVADLSWVPSSADSQLVLKVFDQGAGGASTLVTRGVAGVRDAAVGVAQRVRVQASDFSVLLRAGHRVLAVVTAGDVAYYKPYPGSAGGTLESGDASTLTLPLRTPSNVPPAADGSAQGAPGGGVERQARLRLRARPRVVRAGRRVRIVFTATVRGKRRARAVKGVTVRFAGRRGRTNAKGRAQLAVRLRRAGSYTARASKRGFAPGTARVRVRRRHSGSPRK